MNKEETKLGFWTFVLLWFGAAVSFAEIMTGGLIAPLGFKTGVIVILAGHMIGTSIFVVCGIIGSREQLPAIASTKKTFGSYGTYLFAIINVIQLIGWTAIMILTASSSMNVLSKHLWKVDNAGLWKIITGILVSLWIYFGNTGLKRLNNAAVVLLFGLTLVLGYLIFNNPLLLSTPAVGHSSIGSALEVSVVMPLSWLPLVADYTRFAKTEKAGAYGSFIGYFVGSCWMFIIGLGAAIVSGNSDPSGMMLGVHLGVMAFAVVVLSTVTTTFMDGYSAGVSFLNLLPKADERWTAILMTAIGTILALVLPMNRYLSFLYAIGSVFAPLFAILIVDYFIIQRKMPTEPKFKINWIALIVLVAGIVAYYQFVSLDLILGATTPVMLGTGLLYYSARRCPFKWRS